jgi:glycosyltransferase involved in cell wall biosynthesis
MNSGDALLIRSDGSQTVAFDLTLAVCTWNRAASLRRTLESFAALEVPPGVDFEVLVVDNNSTDDTQCVLAAFADILPLRVVHEPAQGIAYARNRVAQEARGAYVLCTDDDVEVAPDWLAAYWVAFRTHPRVHVFGGVIRTRFEGLVPAWVLAAWPVIADVYGARDLGPEGFDLAPVVADMPYGSNFAVRTVALRRVACDPSLGHCASRPGLGEEIKLLVQLVREGGGRWVPEAVVHHRIGRSRQSLGYVRRRFETYGATRHLYEPSRIPPLDPEAMRRKLRRHTRKLWRKRLRRPASEWMGHLAQAAILRGSLRTLPVGKDPAADTTGAESPRATPPVTTSAHPP